MLRICGREFLLLSLFEWRDECIEVMFSRGNNLALLLFSFYCAVEMRMGMQIVYLCHAPSMNLHM